MQTCRKVPFTVRHIGSVSLSDRAWGSGEPGRAGWSRLLRPKTTPSQTSVKIKTPMNSETAMQREASRIKKSLGAPALLPRGAGNAPVVIIEPLDDCENLGSGDSLSPCKPEGRVGGRVPYCHDKGDGHTRMYEREYGQILLFRAAVDGNRRPENWFMKMEALLHMTTEMSEGGRVNGGEEHLSSVADNHAPRPRQITHCARLTCPRMEAQVGLGFQRRLIHTPAPRWADWSPQTRGKTEQDSSALTQTFRPS
ncbi:hypothetical protein Bbelb_208160 [Branchiostoma belcheri]|nr:hypothetical protein Bbelb_208160 [Branchiostoma belcheri]